MRGGGNVNLLCLKMNSMYTQSMGLPALHSGFDSSHLYSCSFLSLKKKNDKPNHFDKKIGKT